jgi:hypothetical protein
MIDDDGGANSKVMWMGYIKRNRFKNAAGSATEASDVWDGWFICDSGLSAPTAGALNFRDGANSEALNHPTYLADTTGYGVTVATVTGEGSWPESRYNVGITWIYDGIQESLVHPISTIGQLNVVSGDSLVVRIGIFNDSDTGANQTPNATTNARLNPRITGGRVYVQEAGDGTSAEDATGQSWKFLSGWDAGSSGADTTGGGATVGARSAVIVGEWTDNGTDQSYIDITVKEPSLDTYESLNGYTPLQSAISFDGAGMGYFDSVVTNRRAFTCNVSHTNEYGITRRHGDRILYSEPGRFDTFPSNNFIEIGVNDGDEFRALYTYADRLLAFKRKKLYIINIGSGADTAWFLESEHENRGVNHPCSVTDTDYGLAFCNAFGVFIYNGRDVVELSENLLKEDTTGDMDDWYTFVTLNTAPTGEEKPLMGYVKRTKQLIIIASPTTTGESGNAFIYDFKTGSWVFALDVLTDGNEYTNFAQDWTGELIIGETTSNNTQMLIWDDAPANNAVQQLITKDIDFGDPGRAKKVYKMYLTYKASTALQDTGTNDIPLLYSTDGSTTFTNFDTCVVGGSSSATQLDASATNWDVATLGITTPITVQSLALKVDVATSGTMEINDMSIEYRPLHKRAS